MNGCFNSVWGNEDLIGLIEQASIHGSLNQSINHCCFLSCWCVWYKTNHKGRLSITRLFSSPTVLLWQSWNTFSLTYSNRRDYVNMYKSLHLLWFAQKKFFLFNFNWFDVFQNGFNWPESIVALRVCFTSAIARRASINVVVCTWLCWTLRICQWSLRFFSEPKITEMLSKCWISESTSHIQISRHHSTHK